MLSMTDDLSPNRSQVKRAYVCPRSRMTTGILKELFRKVSVQLQRGRDCIIDFIYDHTHHFHLILLFSFMHMPMPKGRDHMKGEPSRTDISDVFCSNPVLILRLTLVAVKVIAIVFMSHSRSIANVFRIRTNVRSLKDVNKITTRRGSEEDLELGEMCKDGDCHSCTHCRSFPSPAPVRPIYSSFSRHFGACRIL